MKLCFVIILALMAGSQANSIFQRTFEMLHKEPPPPPFVGRADGIREEWIDQQLDHYDETETKTWKMRYLANDQHFVDGGPIIIYVGGEWTISPGSIAGGLIYDMAKEHKGYLFYTEHRFYGDSHPTADLGLKNLNYLNVGQALSDLAHFITTMKATIPGLENSKVILVGGSYSATMVTWFKRLFSDLADGCWASSAPLFAKVDFVEYKEITGYSIKKLGGELCYNKIQNGIKQIEEMFAKGKAATVKALFKICDNFDEKNDLDVWNLFSEFSDLFAGLVQSHNTGNIEYACQQIMSEKDNVKGVANWILSRVGGGSQCNDFSYKSMLSSLNDVTWSDGMMRQWFYQTCNEYGWYQTSGSTEQPFGTKFPVELYAAICKDVYGITNETLHQNVMKTNAWFGGLNPAVENVYMTHGELDPWRAMGVQEEGKSTIIPLHAHCKDFGSISEIDTPEMKASKEKIQQLVREWIK